MTFNLQAFVLLCVLSASLHWLFARSKIFEWFWSRADGFTAKLLACPACSGFWLGCILGACGIQPVTNGDRLAIVVSGILAMFGTPVAEAIMLWGLERSAILVEYTEADTAVLPDMTADTLSDENAEPSEIAPKVVDIHKVTILPPPQR